MCAIINTSNPHIKTPILLYSTRSCDGAALVAPNSRANIVAHQISNQASHCVPHVTALEPTLESALGAAVQTTDWDADGTTVKTGMDVFCLLCAHDMSLTYERLVCLFLIKAEFSALKTAIGPTKLSANRTAVFLANTAALWSAFKPAFQTAQLCAHTPANKSAHSTALLAACVVPYITAVKTTLFTALGSALGAAIIKAQLTAQC